MFAIRPLVGIGSLRDRMLLVIVLCLTASLVFMGSPQIQPLTASRENAVRPTGALPQQFIANRGQASESIAFETRGASGTVMFSKGQIILALPVQEGESSDLQTQIASDRTAVVSIELVGTNMTAEIVGVDQLPGVVNYLIGNDPARWHLGVETYTGVRYVGLYSGVDLAYDGSEGLLKGTYTVAPGADPKQIRWRYTGAANVRVNETRGDLRIVVSNGPGTPEVTMTEYAPVAWQDIGSKRVSVPVRYEIDRAETISLAVGSYDPSYPLIIDPVLEYSSFLGGNGGEIGYGIALDEDGNIYIGGATNSTNFPGASGPPSGWQYMLDAFVTKMSADGTSVLFTTIFGGGDQDFAFDIAVDSAGSAHVVGWTGSSDLPTVNAIQPTYGGDYDMFVAKLSPDGRQLAYSTYLGGNRFDIGRGIAVDQQGNAYAIGTTSSWGLPTLNAIQPNLIACQDVYIAQITPVGAMGFGTYLGGPNCETGEKIAVDDLGYIYLAGTAPPQYPMVNPSQNCSPTSYDAFVTKLTPDGQAIVYSTCVGGSNSEEGLDLALDSSYRAYVVGLTSSSDFPTVQAVQYALGSQTDAFITRLSADGQSIEYSTYLGGAEQDRALGVTVTGQGQAVLTGQTMSSDYPVSNAIQNAYAGSGWDAFVTKLSADGALLYSTYLGGSLSDVGYGIASNNLGLVYVTGGSGSHNFPLVNPLQTSNQGDEVFITILGDGNLPPTVSADGPYAVDEGSWGVLVAEGSDPENGDLVYAWDLDLDGVYETPGQTVTFSAAGLDGPHVSTVAVRVTDPGGLTAVAQAQVVIQNVEPSASYVATPANVHEGQSTMLSLNSPFDPGAADTAAGFRYSFDCTGDGVFDVQDSADGAINCTYQDDGIYTTTGRIKDKDGGLTDYVTSIIASNVPPNVGPISAPHDPARVSTNIEATAPFQDAGVLDTHTAIWDWGDGNTSTGTVSESQGSGEVSGSHVYLSPGVYTVRLIVHDDDGGIGEAVFEYVVVYDAEGGFVTGGGWINSPVGACQLTPACQTTAGRATFGFVSKYKKGASVPTGTTQFQFQAGGLNFHSSSYQWLVVAGPKATFKGEGTINGQGDFGFMLSAVDGQINGGGGADKFRIKLWDKVTGAVVYDNQMNDPETGNPTTILGGGSIVIHR